jgi:ferredoxin
MTGPGPVPPARRRGTLALIPDKCTSCMICARECPDWCIHIDSHTETIPAPSPPMHNHYNGLKTAALFGAIWALLLGLAPSSAAAATSGSSRSRRRDDVLRVLEQRQARDPRHARLPGQRGPSTAMYRIVRELSTAAASRCRRSTSRRPTRPMPLRPAAIRTRGRVLHRGHPAVARRTRAARGARARAHARLQPRHPHLVGGRGRRRCHHVGRADAHVLRWRQ